VDIIKLATLAWLGLFLVACQRSTPTPTILPTPTPPPTKIFVTPAADEVKKVSDTIMIKYQAWESGNWDVFYDALHPDSKNLISKDDFINYWKARRQGFLIKNPEIRDVKFVKSDQPPGFNQTYTNVAEVMVKFEQELAGKPVTTQDGINYLVQDNGKWLILWKKP